MIDFHYETVGKDKDIVAVVLSGRLTEENCNYLFECVEGQILEGRKKLILDCGHLSYISSMGLGTLVRVSARMKKIGGEVKLAALQSVVVQIMSVMGLNRVFQIYPSVVDAISALDS
ncbi:anti-sigma factor antagonist [soil metagenome]